MIPRLIPLLILLLIFTCKSVVVQTEIKHDEKSKSVVMEHSELTLLTYNVMGSKVRPDIRIPAIKEIITNSDPQIIAFQEVDEVFFEKFRNDPQIASVYEFSTTTFSDLSGGLLILSKFRLSSIDYYLLPASRLNRYALIVSLKINNERFDIASIHLDSFLEDGVRRSKQLDFVFDKLNLANNSILLGDFNFGDLEQPETEHLNPSYFDLWTDINPSLPGFTWDVQTSNLALRGSFPNEPSRRLDRILVKSKNWTSKNCTIVGDESLIQNSKDLFPSDHFGVLGTIKSSNN